MRILLLIIILISTKLIGQELIYPYNTVEVEFDRLLKSTTKIDSIISASYKLEYREQYIMIGLFEGPIELTDSLGIDIGDGGYTAYTFKNENTKEIIKAEYNRTIHYKYDVRDSLNANTERIEISIYYKNDEAYFAIFNEYHYDNMNVISVNKYYLELNPKREDVYYSNEFQEKMRKYILSLSEFIVNEN